MYTLSAFVCIFIQVNLFLFSHQVLNPVNWHYVWMSVNVCFCVFNHMLTAYQLFQTDFEHLCWFECVWSPSPCFLRNGKKHLPTVGYFIFPSECVWKLGLYVSVRQSLLVSQENTESCKSDISLPGGGPGRIAGRFHLSHIAPWSGWLLLASPISLPFVPICAQRSVCLNIQRARWERTTVPQTWKVAAHIPTMNEYRWRKWKKDESVITPRE